MLYKICGFTQFILHGCKITWPQQWLLSPALPSYSNGFLSPPSPWKSFSPWGWLSPLSTPIPTPFTFLRIAHPLWCIATCISCSLNLQHNRGKRCVSHSPGIMCILLPLGILPLWGWCTFGFGINMLSTSVGTVATLSMGGTALVDGAVLPVSPMVLVVLMGIMYVLVVHLPLVDGSGSGKGRQSNDTST